MGQVLVVTAPAAHEPPRSLRSVMLAPPRLLSLAVGTLFWWAALVPSLLPRSAFMQRLIGGVAFAVGWAVGALLAAGWVWAWRRAGRPDPLDAVRPLLVRVFAVAAVLAAVAGSIMWLRWQNQQRTVTGPDEVLGLGDVVQLWLTTAVLAAVAVGRAYAFVVMRIDHQMTRRLPAPLRQVTSGTVVSVIAVLLVSAVVVWGLIPYANATFGAADATPTPALPAPQAATVSGGQGSLVSWDSLGNEGQFFTATATSTDAIRTLRPGVAAVPPIRVYVGLRDAPDAAARAALAVKELDRTGAFQREVLVVWTSTGTGWVDPTGAAALEYLHAGNTAIVSQQYSFLPSWISFLVDKEKASDAGRALFEAVYARWSQLPAGSRPRLVAFGESLGSFGGEAAFARATDRETLEAVATLPDAALFTGPTADNVAHSALLATRVPGSPVWAPGSALGPTVHLADRGQDLAALATRPRVLWVQHPSDPVGQWTWSTIWSRPAWMQQPTGWDVPQDPSWFPVVSWLQSTIDLVNGFSSAPGHGHNYDPDFAAAWATVAPPAGWAPADTDRLARALLNVPQN